MKFNFLRKLNGWGDYAPFDCHSDFLPITGCKLQEGRFTKSPNGGEEDIPRSGIRIQGEPNPPAEEILNYYYPITMTPMQVFYLYWLPSMWKYTISLSGLVLSFRIKVPYNKAEQFKEWGETKQNNINITSPPYGSILSYHPIYLYEGGVGFEADEGEEFTDAFDVIFSTPPENQTGEDDPTKREYSLTHDLKNPDDNEDIHHAADDYVEYKNPPALTNYRKGLIQAELGHAFVYQPEDIQITPEEVDLIELTELIVDEVVESPPDYYGRTYKALSNKYIIKGRSAVTLNHTVIDPNDPPTGDELTYMDNLIVGKDISLLVTFDNSLFSSYYNMMPFWYCPYNSKRRLRPLLHSELSLSCAMSSNYYDLINFRTLHYSTGASSITDANGLDINMWSLFNFKMLAYNETEPRPIIDLHELPVFFKQPLDEPDELQRTINANMSLTCEVVEHHPDFAEIEGYDDPDGSFPNYSGYDPTATGIQ